MNPTERLNQAPRCSARSKRSGSRCRAPAKKGWTVCRFHGAGGGAPTGRDNGRWRGGGWSKEALARRRELASLIRECRQSLKDLEDA